MIFINIFKPCRRSQKQNNSLSNLENFLRMLIGRIQFNKYIINYEVELFHIGIIILFVKEKITLCLLESYSYSCPHVYVCIHTTQLEKKNNTYDALCVGYCAYSSLWWGLYFHILNLDRLWLWKFMDKGDTTHLLDQFYIHNYVQLRLFPARWKTNSYWLSQNCYHGQWRQSRPAHLVFLISLVGCQIHSSSNWRLGVANLS